MMTRTIFIIVWFYMAIANNFTVTADERQRLMSLPKGYDPFYNSDAFYYDAEAAQKAVDFFPLFLQHVKGQERGKPFELNEWQDATVRNLWGWKNKDTDYRRYREAFIYVPRKNGKTTFVAGLLLLAFACDDEPGAELYSAAADRVQSKIIFDICTGMVQADEKLSDHFTCQQYRIISKDDPLSTYAPLSHESHTKHGYNPNFIVVDEVHAQKDGDLIDVLNTGTGAREQPLTIYITTADYERPSACNALLERSQKVAAKEIDDPQFLPVLFYADQNDDWKSEETWKKANPNYGVSLKEEYMERACREAIDSPKEENKFKRLHLNMKTEQSERWISVDHWDSCPNMFSKEKLLGASCYAGLDMASTNDITSIVLFFPDTVSCLSKHWLPKANFHKRKMNAQFYDKGELFLTDGSTTDYRIVKEHIGQMAKDYNIIDIGFDPYNATHIAQELNEEYGIEMIQFRQGAASMNEPLKRLEQMLINHELTHFESKILRWMLGNVVISYGQNETMRIDRKKATEKVDGIVALTMGVGRWLASERPAQSIYSSRGLLEL